MIIIILVVLMEIVGVAIAFGILARWTIRIKEGDK